MSAFANRFELRCESKRLILLYYKICPCCSDLKESSHLEQYTKAFHFSQEIQEPDFQTNIEVFNPQVLNVKTMSFIFGILYFLYCSVRGVFLCFDQEFWAFLRHFAEGHFTSEIPYTLLGNPEKNPEVLKNFLGNPEILKRFFRNPEIFRKSQESSNPANAPFGAIFCKIFIIELNMS